MSKGKLREQLKGYQRMKPLIAIKEYLMIIFCTIPYAIAVNWILVPHTIVGGGLTGARKYIMPSVLAEMRSTLSQLTEGERTARMPVAVYELDDEAQFERFARGEQRELKVYGSERTVSYDPEKRIGIVFSKLGASRAVSLGAYAFALNELDNRR